MAEKGDLNWIAATLGSMQKDMRQANDKRLDSFTNLLSSIESSLADVVENVEKGGGAAAIEAMAKAIQSIQLSAPAVTVNVSPTPIEVNVPEQQPPTVNVQVSPTPVTLEATLASPEVHNHINVPPAPDSKGAKWKVTMPTQYGDRVMTIERTA